MSIIGPTLPVLGQMATQSPDHWHAFLKHRIPTPIIGSTAGSHSSAKLTTSTAYQPSAGNEPYAIKKKFDAKRQLTSAELEGFWTFEKALDPQPDRKLLDTFFPVRVRSGLDYFQLSDKYGDAVRRSAVQRNGRRKDVARGWKNWPSPPPRGQKWYKEKEITARIIPLLNHIITVLGLEHSRVAIDLQTSRITCRDGGDLGPDVFLLGHDSRAFPPLKGNIVPNTVEAWKWCVCPIEIKTEEERGGPTNQTTFHQLGTYVREILAAQEHRRYLPSLLLTECTGEFLLWDRGGVVVSERIDYHEEDLEDPANDKHLLFCNMLAGIVKWKDAQLGFDPTVWYHDESLHIETKEVFEQATDDGIYRYIDEVEYAVEATLFRSYTLRGRGSTCWRVRKLGDPNDDSSYLILDSWVKRGCGSERTILQKMNDALVVDGIAPVVHIEDVTHPDKAHMPQTDEVKCIRRAAAFAMDIDLVHTRSVLRCDGTPLENFTSAKELVSVLHDIIHAHGQAYTRAGILHRDIVPWNMLITRNSTGGSRGVLIDFSCATSIDPHEAVPRPEPILGASWFMCSNALQKNNTLSHLDDLESFYWVFCVITTLHTGPGPSSPRLDPGSAMKVLLDSDWQTAARMKRAHFSRPFDLPVAPFFGPTVVELARKLHFFFYKRIILPEFEDITPVDPNTDYQNISACFQQAIQELENQSDTQHATSTDPFAADTGEREYRKAFHTRGIEY